MLTGHQIRNARELLGWSRADLARNTLLALSVVEVVEEHGSTFMLLDRQLSDLRSALEAAGVEFVREDGGGARVKLRKVEQEDVKR